MTSVTRTRLALVVALLGWLGLLTLVQVTWPGPIEQVLFLALLFVAVGAAVAVLVRPFHYRFARRAWLECDPWRAEREGFLAGVWLVLVVWLRMQRILDLGSLLILATVVVLVELAMLVRHAP